MKKTFVSIIIPVYNAEVYLNRCIDSAINQTLLNIQVIIIDDKSTDNSVKIIKEYARSDNRINLITNEINLGVGVSRNLGIEKAIGQYLLFIDADDWIDQKACEVLYNIAKNYKLDVLEASYKVVHKPEAVQVNDNFQNDENNIKIETGVEYLTKNRLVPAVWNKLWLKDYVVRNNIKFYPNIYGEDVKFSLEGMIKVERFAKIEYPFYYYYQSPESQRRQNPTDKHFLSHLTIKRYVKNLYLQADSNSLRKILSKVLSENLVISLRYLRDGKNIKPDLIAQLKDEYRTIMKLLNYKFLVQPDISFFKKLIIYISPNLFNKVIFLKDFISFKNRK